MSRLRLYIHRRTAMLRPPAASSSASAPPMCPPLRHASATTCPPAKRVSRQRSHRRAVRRPPSACHLAVRHSRCGALLARVQVCSIWPQHAARTGQRSRTGARPVGWSRFRICPLSFRELAQVSTPSSIGPARTGRPVRWTCVALSGSPACSQSWECPGEVLQRIPVAFGSRGLYHRKHEVWSERSARLGARGSEVSDVMSCVPTSNVAREPMFEITSRSTVSARDPLSGARNASAHVADALGRFLVLQNTAARGTRSEPLTTGRPPMAAHPPLAAAADRRGWPHPTGWPADADSPPPFAGVLLLATSPWPPAAGRPLLGLPLLAARRFPGAAGLESPAAACRLPPPA